MQELPRILLVVPRLNIGGAETYVAALARALRQRGYSVALASWGGKLAQSLMREGMPHYLIPVRYSFPLAARLLRRAMAKERIDLVHANAADAGVVAALACAPAQRPWVFTAHGEIRRTQVKYACIAQANSIICVSDYLSAQLIRDADFPPEQLITLYNGIDLHRYTARGVRAAVRRAWGVGENDYLLGIASRIFSYNRKGHQDLSAHSRRRSARRPLARHGHRQGELSK